MRSVGFSVVVAVAVALAGCATFAPEHAQSVAGSRCDEAVGQGVAFGRWHARAIADSHARVQTDDVRGFLLAAGLRHVRPAGRSASCAPYGLGAGLTQCTVIARYCGR